MKESKSKIPVNIKKINLVSSWNIIADPKDENEIYDCKLCKRPLLAPPLEELDIENKFSIEIEGKLLKGMCGDIFHEKCINSYLKSGLKSDCMGCPTCNTLWQQSKNLYSNVVTQTMESVTMKKKTKT